MQKPVAVQITGGIAVLTVDNPPENALSGLVRAELLGAISDIENGDEVRAIVLAARGKRYASDPDPDDGADAATAPALADLADRIEACRLPVIAAMHGRSEGAGLELALAAHYRIADRRAVLGFPGVRVGMMPCAGATQRLPRLVGAARAIEFLSAARMVDAKSGLAMGLVDAVAKGPLPAFVLEWVRARLKDGMAPRPTRDLSKALEPRQKQAEVVKTAQSQAKDSTIPAIRSILDCIGAALVLPFDAGMAKEKAAYHDCVASDLSRALRHVARAEERVQIPPVDASVKPRKISSIGVVGAGRIGRGVAILALDAGYPVTLIETDIDRIEDAVEAIIDFYDQEIAAKRMDAVSRDRRISQLTGKIGPDALASVDLVIEATTEDAKNKRRVFTALDAVMKRGAILATTTSTLDLDGLAAGTGRAGKIVGLHFFPPAHRIRTVEVVAGAATSDTVIATAFDVVKRMGRIPVATAVSDGYLAIRMAAALVDAAVLLLLRGSSVSRIDGALEAYGFAMGPLKLADAIGIDVLQAVARPHQSEPFGRVQEFLSRMAKAGHVGRRAGKGFYRYAGSRAPIPDKAAARLIKGLVKRSEPLEADEICRRCLSAVANQGAHLVQDGVAQRPSDLDVLMVHVFGFPRSRGGPMMAADLTGIPRVKRDLDSFAADGPELWTPVDLWTELLESNRDFGSLNR